MSKRKLGRGVAVVGAGMCRFGAFPEKTSRDLAVEAFLEMKSSVDKGLDPRDIQSLYLGNFSSDLFEGQGHLAPIIAEWLGLVPIPASRVEDACASGGVALRQGVLAIASGLYDVVLVVGAEKMTSLPTERVTDTLAAASDVLYEASAGFTFPGLYAAMATAYLDRYRCGVEPLRRVAIKNHENGALNPKAQFNSSLRQIMQGRIARAKERGQPVPAWRDEMDFLEDLAANPMVAYPLRLFDCSPITDGAACLLLVAEEIASRFTDHPLHIVASAQASEASLLQRPDLTSLGAARAAASAAYQMAGIQPADIKVAEVHDCFTIAELIATEDLGFFAPGEGARAALAGRTSREGDRPVNTSGGLKSKGHPVGASGVAQATEVWLQLREKAGERQLKGKELDLGLTHNVGGTGNTCVVHIYERRR